MTRLTRRLVLSLTGAALIAPAALAASPAETFIADGIHAGLAILNNAQLTAAQRRTQFAAFLLGVTDMKRIALFTLGDSTASDADKAAFVAAFQDYATAVYQSYFARYSGQTLTVLRSSERAPGDVIVATSLKDPGGAPPLEIDFRVRSDGAKPVIVDCAVAGVWLALSQRDDFAAVLAKSHGDIGALIAHLRAVAAQP